MYLRQIHSISYILHNVILRKESFNKHKYLKTPGNFRNNKMRIDKYQLNASTIKSNTNTEVKSKDFRSMHNFCNS